MKELMRLLRVWKLMTLGSIQVAFVSRLGASFFLFAKALRTFFFFATVIIIFPKSVAVAGFSREQIVLLLFMFTLLDSLSQMLFREVYRFRPRIISGDFDLDLLKPLPSLFRPLLGGVDPLDMLMLIPMLAITATLLIRMEHANQIPVFIFLLIPGLLIATSFHILVLSLGILTTQIENAIMVYRDIWGMGRFPVKMYEGAIGVLLRFIIPVGIMVTLPTQILIGEKEAGALLIPFVFSVLFFCGSLVVWKQALRHYTSASS